jgi:hypothetical protein
MIGPEGPIAILTNWGATTKVSVRFAGTHAVIDAITEEVLPVEVAGGSSIVSLIMTSGSSALLLTK